MNKLLGFILFFLLFVSFFTCNLEEIEYNPVVTKFEKWFNEDDRGTSVIELPEGGYIVVGSRSLAKEALIAKFSSNGDPIWSKSVKLGDSADFIEVKRTPEGGYIAVGTCNFSSNSDIFLCKFDKDGKTEFSKNFSGLLDGDSGRDVVVANDGFVVLGLTSNSTDGQMMLLKTNSEGIPQDTKYYGGTGREIVIKIIKTQDNGYAVVGNTNSFGAGLRDIYLCKLTSSLAVSWLKSFGTASNEYGNDIIEDSEGNFIMCGETIDANFQAKIYVVKTDKKGALLQENTFADYPGVFCKGIALTVSNNYLLTGFNIHNSDLNSYIFQLNSSLEFKRDTLFSPVSATDIKSTLDGGIVITGNYGLTNRPPLYLLKIDKDWKVK